ncbi:hypothetical protein [Vulcanisaeta thermophila]|uniref:hypothetical protein n=1 Tax=Vulcanisaeta thermophila TaxID=867917 RepID=UPI000853E8B3|nr:hypothetical protein [Vulcanisaeta thermophila]
MAEEITALLMLRNHGRMGRYLLSSISGMGEGIARRVLENLRKNGAIKVSRGGAEITDKGEELLRDLLRGIGVKNISEVSGFNKVLKCECSRCIAAVLSTAIMEDHLMRLRDEAIKGGSDAVLFMRYTCPEGRFMIYRLGSYLGDFDRDAEENLRRSLTPDCDDDVVVLCGGNYYRVIKSLVHIMGFITKQP